jgi:hypothetical protein
LHWFKMRQAFGVLIDYWFNMNHVWVLAFKCRAPHTQHACSHHCTSYSFN